MAKIALLIGVSEYDESRLNPLPAAIRDAQAMQRVLQHPDLGAFDQVQVLENPQKQPMEEAIDNLFAYRQKDDLVLLYFSGHGVKDDQGRLYFATRITRKRTNGELVKATAVPASFVHDVMNGSRSKRQVVLLDCCFSGAFAEGLLAKDDGSIDIKAQLGAEGRAVLTSSTSTQYSLEQQGSDLSVYTRFIIEGLETGVADTDNDGVISVDELHEYARKKVQEAAPAMKPEIYAIREGFKIHLAKAPVDDAKVRYRKEVERRTQRGEITRIGRRILNRLQLEIKLSTIDATAIEDEVLKPYREYQQSLQEYKQALVEAAQQENPLGEYLREELKQLQNLLNLRDEDIAPIQALAVIPAPAPPVEVYISYSRKDTSQCQELKRKLKPLEQQELIQIWFDELLQPGQEWRTEIDAHLNSAQIILLLVSPNSLASDFISTVEVPRAMERHDVGEACVIPIVLERIDWRGQPFNKLQALPRNLSLWENGEESFVSIAEDIQMVARDIQLGNRLLRIPDGIDGEVMFEESGTTDDSPQQVSLTDESIVEESNYAKLRDLLKAGNWKKADQETSDLMHLAVSKSQIRVKDLKNFPCQPLIQVDQLWQEYSNGKFGFGIQAQLWQELNADEAAFDARVGWRADPTKRQRNYNNLTFSLNAPPGHLPAFFKSWGGGGWTWKGHLLSRFNDCKTQDSQKDDLDHL